ncbi:LysR family substrate-binding domain-containing protein [Paenarthrobacter sp. CAP02]|uniref:LysR family substrate-binding domain-containing protein n=1 Tax=Paenarthrobacter TaxID=1742992 RepID=UPI002096E621
MERVKQDVAAAGRGEAGRVRIAFAGASTHVMVGRLARAARSRLPGLVLELSSQNYAQPAMSRVLTGEVDIGIGRWDHIPAGIETRVLVNEQLMLAVPKNHPLAGRHSTPVSAFEDEPFVVLPAHPGSVLTDRLFRLCHAAGFEPRIVQEAPDSYTGLALVSAEVGTMLTISSVAENTDHHGVSFIPVSDEIDGVQLRMAWKTDSQNPGLKTILSLAEEVLPQELPGA